jgi:hypothetical protein
MISKYVLVSLSVWTLQSFYPFLIIVWIWQEFLKNDFLLVVIAVVYLQPWLKNKLVFVRYARAVIWIR